MCEDPWIGVCLGDIVELYAADWGVHEQQLDDGYEFEIVRGRVYGRVVRITEDAITIAPQVFDGGGVRYALALPKATILTWTILRGADHA